MEKIEKNVRYIVTTEAEDEWFRKWADKQGYVWVKYDKKYNIDKLLTK